MESGKPQIPDRWHDEQERFRFERTYAKYTFFETTNSDLWSLTLPTQDATVSSDAPNWSEDFSYQGDYYSVYHVDYQSHC